MSVANLKRLLLLCVFCGNSISVPYAHVRRNCVLSAYVRMYTHGADENYLRMRES